MLDFEISQEIEQLKNEGNLKKLKEKCKELPEDDEESHVLHISILAYIGIEEKLEEIKEICERDSLKNNVIVQRKYMAILRTAIEKEKNSKKIKAYIVEARDVANRKELKNNEEIQKGFISLLKESIKKEKDLEKIKAYIVETKDIANREELKSNKEIQRGFISLLRESIKREEDSKKINAYIIEARDVANREEFKNSKEIQKGVISLLKEGIKREKDLEKIKAYIVETKDIANREELKNSEEIQRGFISLLKESIKREKDSKKRRAYIVEARDVANREEFKNNGEIQKVFIDVLEEIGLAEHLEEIKEICERDNLKNNVNIQQKYARILRIIHQLNNKKGNEAFNYRVPRSNLDRVKKYPKETSKEMSTKKGINPFLNRIKTKLYYDDVDTELINQVKQDEEKLSQIERTIALIAIYDKQKNIKTATKLIKEAKKILEGNKEIVKQLNIIHQAMIANKNRIFDWSNYDRILGWNLDNNVAEEIKSKREREEKEKETEEAKVRVRKKAEISKKVESKEPKKPQKPQRRMITVKPKKDTSTQRYETKKKTNNKKKNINEETEEQLIENVFGKELDTMRKQILKGKREIVYEDSRIKVSSKYDKVPPEAVEELREKMQKEKDLTEDYYVVQRISQKVMSDFRAKMQMVLLLRKYDMKEVADEKLKEESEIYDNLNKVIYEQRRLKRIKKIQAKRKKANPEYDKSDIIKLLESRVSEITQDTMDKISQVQGNNEFAYKLLNREAIDEERN